MVGVIVTVLLGASDDLPVVDLPYERVKRHATLRGRATVKISALEVRDVYMKFMEIFQLDQASLEMSLLGNRNNHPLRRSVIARSRALQIRVALVWLRPAHRCLEMAVTGTLPVQ